MEIFLNLLSDVMGTLLGWLSHLVVFVTTIFMVLLSLLLGSAELPFEKLPSLMQLEVFTVHDELLLSGNVVEGAMIYQKLESLINDKQSDWYMSYMPSPKGTLEFHAENFVISCYEHYMTIESPGHVLLEKKLPNLLERLDAYRCRGVDSVECAELKVRTERMSKKLSHQGNPSIQ